MDHGSKACVGFVAAHGDTLELFEFTEEILDEMARFIDLWVDGDRISALRTLRNDDPCATFIQLKDDPVGIESLIGDEGREGNAFDERRDADCIMALARQQNEANQIAQCIREREDFRRQTAFGLANGLALSPPFAPCPWSERLS
jgi:hypothetical protein